MSGNGKLRPIHVAKNLTELNDMVEKDNTKIIEQTPPKLLIKSIEKIYSQADLVERIECDEETAYILYMRFLNGIQWIRKSKKDSAIVDSFKPKILKALQKSDDISKRLKKRYDTAQEIKEADKKLQEIEFQDAQKMKEARIILPMELNGTTKSDEELINPNVTSTELKNLMDEKCRRFLLIDCRSPDDYKSSHPKHTQTIVIPPIILVKGQSANQIGDKLKSSYPDSFLHWDRRETFDLIILYDWNSSFESRDNTSPSPISVLYTAITEYDPNRKYIGVIKILQGGIRSFHRKYPTYLTNPTTFTSDSFSTSQFQSTPIGSITYPNIDEESNNNHNIKNNGTPSSLNSGKTTMGVDRSTKPIQSKINQSPIKSIKIESEIEEKGKQVSDLLDDIIKISNEAKETEKDFSNIKFQNDPNVEKLMEKDDQIKKINLQLEQKSKDYEKLKSLYDEALEKDREKMTLPPLHPSSIQSSIAAKEITRSELDAHVKRIREERKMKELEYEESKSKLIQNPTPSISSKSPISNLKFSSNEEIRSSGSNLQRSKSNPHLNKINSFDNDIPAFNRNQKPQSKRECSTISSTQCLITGLKNLGNTCYMNSIVQCLSHTRRLADYLTSEVCRSQLNSNSSSTRGEITKELGMTIQQLQAGHRSIAPEDLKRVIGRHHHPFKGYGQQDSHELLTLLLDWIHEELNKIKIKARRLEQKNDGTPDDVAADAAWKDYISSNQSRIIDLFCGEQKSSVRCCTCGKESITFETFFILSVPIPPSKKSNLNECLDLYTSVEEIPDWKCVHCSKKVKAQKKIDLWRLPHYLIIHLQRFYNEGYWRKRLNEVDFPIIDLDLRKRIKGNSIDYNYNLYGVSNHYGSMEGGHYTAFCKNKESWSKFDDSDVSCVIPREVCTSAAYILFYENIN